MKHEETFARIARASEDIFASITSAATKATFAIDAARSAALRNLSSQMDRPLSARFPLSPVYLFLA
jgi:hypothetical protein